jgi:hypothetical protein
VAGPRKTQSIDNATPSGVLISEAEQAFCFPTNHNEESAGYTTGGGRCRDGGDKQIALCATSDHDVFEENSNAPRQGDGVILQCVDLH